MKIRRRDLLAAPLLCLAPRANAGAVLNGLLPAAAAGPADQRAFLGVNIHIEYTDGKYADLPAVAEKLAWLGAVHVRDSAPNPTWHGQEGYTTLAAAGIRFSLICWLPPEEQLAAIKQRFPNRDAIAQLEGPNELNNNPTFNYKGRLGPAAGAGYIADLKSAVAADPFFRGVPVAGVVSYPVISTSADLANVHSYPKGGARPRGQLSADVKAQRTAEPRRPVVVTEAGYNTGEVSEAVQAERTVQLVRDARALGVARLYLYELLDDRPDNHWGLFRLDGTPKPAAHAVRALLNGGRSRDA